MLDWESLTVLCVGGAGQTGREICRRLLARNVAAIVIHDLDLARARAAVDELGADNLFASAGDVFAPKAIGAWEFVDADGPYPRACREVEGATSHPDRVALLEKLLDSRLGVFSPDVVRDSLIWNLVTAYRPNVVVDCINTATVLGYAGDVIQGGRTLAGLARRIFASLDPDRPIGKSVPQEVQGELVDVLRHSLDMTAHLDVACMIRFVQCLHALFREPELAVPEFKRYVKVHTTGLGGMGFNIRYTHGDTGEPGLSTKLLGKVCATGSFTQLLMTLAHTPGCDVRVVVPATLVGWGKPPDARIEGYDLVDSRDLVPCDGKSTLNAALQSAPERVVETGRTLRVPYLNSGENRPYGAEDIHAITALGQMGCITKEEVARATVESVAGESRYDVLTAMDAALLLPTQTAAVERDRLLSDCGVEDESGFELPSISIGNLGPTIAKHLYELEIIRAGFETVRRVVEEADEMAMTLRACSYLLEDREGRLLRRQIVSLGIPVFLRKGPGQTGLLLGKRLLYPSDPDALDRPLDPDDEQVRKWIQTGWVDLTGERMRWWRERFAEVLEALNGERSVSRNWFHPDKPFTAGRFLAYLYSISGGERKEYV